MSDYIVDLKYSSGIKQFQNPVRMDFVSALITGKPMKSTNPYKYLDIGCGVGVTLISLAAANPDAKFYGVDINSEHIEEAMWRSEKYGIHNIEFIKSDLSELHKMDLPEFDFITTHGMYSWIPFKVRQKLLDYVADNLAEDGIFYIHYAALPGRNAIGPVWNLMQEYSSDIQGSLQRVEKSLGLVQHLLEYDRGYFQSYVVARERAQALFKQDLSYIAHESLNEAWEANYHFQVNRELQKRGMQYVGHSNYMRNYWEYCVPDELYNKFEHSPSDEIRETLIDYIDLSPSRMDLYTKLDFSSGKRTFVLPACIYGVKDLNGNYVKGIELLNGNTIDYNDEIYQKLMGILHFKPSTIEQLTEYSELKLYSKGDISSAIENLLIGEQIQVFRRPPIQEMPANVAGITIVGLYNQEKLQPGNWRKGGITLASQIIGSTVKIQLLDAVLLYMLSMDINLSVEERVKHILTDKNAQQLAASGVRLNAQSLGQYIPIFLQERLWKYIQLGIVGPAV